MDLKSLKKFTCSGIGNLFTETNKGIITRLIFDNPIKSFQYLIVMYLQGYRLNVLQARKKHKIKEALFYLLIYLIRIQLVLMFTFNSYIMR